LLAPGNPLKLAAIDDVIAKRASPCTGAPAQLLLLALAAPGQHPVDRLASAGPGLPMAPISRAIRAAALILGSRRVRSPIPPGSFVSIVGPFDLVMRQRDYFRPALQTLLKFLRSDELSARAQEMGGYDLRDAGGVRFII
jgi:hypothetical protein